MFNLPSSVLVGTAVVLAIWLATLVLSVASLRSSGRRAVAMGVIALGISLLGATVLSARIGKKMTATDMLPNGEKRIRTSGWQVDTRWFFVASSAISLLAVIVALRAQARTTG
jgi:hypothetical protein